MDEARSVVDKILGNIEEELWERRRILGERWLEDDSTTMLGEVDFEVFALGDSLNSDKYIAGNKTAMERAAWRANRIAAKLGVLSCRIHKEMEDADKPKGVSSEAIKGEIMRVMALQTITCEEISVIMPHKEVKGEVFIRGEWRYNGEWVEVDNAHHFSHADVSHASQSQENLREFARDIVSKMTEAHG